MDIIQLRRLLDSLRQEVRVELDANVDEKILSSALREVSLNSNLRSLFDDIIEFVFTNDVYYLEQAFKRQNAKSVLDSTVQSLKDAVKKRINEANRFKDTATELRNVLALNDLGKYFKIWHFFRRFSGYLDNPIKTYFELPNRVVQITKLVKELKNADNVKVPDSIYEVLKKIEQNKHEDDIKKKIIAHKNVPTTADDIKKYILIAEVIDDVSDAKVIIEERLKDVLRTLERIDYAFNDECLKKVQELVSIWSKIGDDEKNGAKQKLDEHTDTFFGSRFTALLDELSTLKNVEQLRSQFIKNQLVIVEFSSPDKIIKNLDRAIEAIKKRSRSSVKPEAPKSAPLQRYAFADERVDVPSEPDTKLEKSLYDELRSHFINNERMSPKAVNEFKELLSQRLYRSVIRGPSKGTVLYRGMYVDDTYLKKILDDIDIEPTGDMEIDYTYATDQSSSWTFSFEKAKDFASGTKPLQIILVAYAEDNPNSFLSAPKALYRLRRIDSYENEVEAVGLGDIKCSRIIWKSWNKTW